MPTSYERIYENLLPKLRDYDIAVMTTDEVKDMLHDYLIPAITRFHVCRKDLTDRDDILERFECELSDVEIEILGNYALLEYIDSNHIRTQTLLKASLSSSDFNSYSPANMLDKLMAMHSRFLSENEGLLSRYAWMGAKESGVLKNAGYKKSKLRF